MNRAAVNRKKVEGMEDKNQPPARHRSHLSTDAKPEAGHPASSLELKPAAGHHAHSRARDRRVHFREDVPRSQSSVSRSKPMSILEAPPLTSQPRAPAPAQPNMHTILEFRAQKPGARAMDKSCNNNNDVDNGPMVNGFGKPAKTWPTVLIGGPLKSGSPRTDNDRVVPGATNGVGRAHVINETSINGSNNQNHGPPKKTSHGTSPEQMKAVFGELRLDHVATNNRRNSWKEGRFEANIVLAQSIEKTQKQKSGQTPAPESNGGQPKSHRMTNERAHFGNKNPAPSGQVNGHSQTPASNGHVNGQNQKPAAEQARSQFKANGVHQQVFPETEVTRNNGHHDVTAVSLAEVCRSDQGSTRSWSLRSDMSYVSDSDEEEDVGFFLQENASAEDGVDDETSWIASFAGRRNYLMPEKVICGVTGTVRGMRNRVRAGMATFDQMANNVTKNFSQLENSKVVVYTTSNGIVRETFQKCLKVKTILSTFLVPFEERDIFKSRAYQRELVDRLTTNHVAVPQVFVEGHYLGDANIIEDLNEQGKLRKILRPYKRPGALIPCQKCGGYKLLLCNACNGSKKSVRRNCFTESLGSMRCSKCDECGLIQCDLCCTVQRDDMLINT